MSVQFQCPSCARYLFYESGEETFQVCRHCGGRIIVPATVVHQQEALDAVPTERELIDQRNYHIAEIQSVLNAGNKIEAIKMFRQAFNTGLAEAKQAVEMLETGRRIPTSALEDVEPVDQTVKAIGGPVQDPETNPAAALAILAAVAIFGIAVFILFILGN